jgi:hypothetical protein
VRSTIDRQTAKAGIRDEPSTRPRPTMSSCSRRCAFRGTGFPTRRSHRLAARCPRRAADAARARAAAENRRS